MFAPAAVPSKPMLGSVRLLKRAQLGQDDSVDPSTVNEVSSGISTFIETIKTETQALQEEYRTADTPVIGEAFTREEFLWQIAMVANRVASIAESVDRGVLAPYASQSQKLQLQQLSANLRSLANQANSAGAQPIREGHEGLSEQHLLAHSEDAQDLKKALEEIVVSAESGGVPIREQSEIEIEVATGILVGVGALVLAGALYYFSSN